MSAADLIAVLIAANIAGSSAILAVLALRASVRRLAGARLAYLSWLIAPAAIAASLLPARAIVLPAAAPAAISSPATSLPPLAEAASVAAVEAPANTAPFAPASWAPIIEWTLVFAIVWIAGSLGALAWLAVGQFLAVRALGPLTRISATTLRAARSGLGPAVVGILAPRIVLPADFEQTYDEAERKVVLAHEEAHLRGGDTVVKTIAHLFACLCWFNPLAWIATHAIAVDQELACDEAVAARYPSELRTYARVLLKTQTGLRAPMGCYWPAGSAHQLKARIARLGLAAPTGARRVVGATAIACLALAAGCVVWSAKPPEERTAKEAGNSRFAPVSLEGPRALADLADYVIIRGKVVRLEGDPAANIWVQAEEISRNGGPPQPNTAVWRMSMDALRRGAPANLSEPAPGPPAQVGPSVGRNMWFHGYAYLDKSCAPDCFALATSIWNGASGGWPTDKARPATRDMTPQPVVLNPRIEAPRPQPQTANLPAGLNADDQVYIRGKVEKIEFGDTTYVVHVRAESIARDPYALIQPNTQLWALFPVNYFGDPKNRDSLAQSLSNQPLFVFGHRAGDTSCNPACSIRAISVVLNPPASYNAGFGGPPGKPIHDAMTDRSAAIELTGTVVRFDTNIESGSPDGVLWIELESATPASTPGAIAKSMWRVVGFPASAILSNTWQGKTITVNGFNTRDRNCVPSCVIIGTQFY